jgi:integrase/recombinase XerD
MEKSRPLINDSGSELLFVSMRGRRLQPQALCDLVKKYACLAGIEKNITTHTFRHSCAVHMLKGNADIRYVQKQLGHKRISTTERYLKIEITDLKEAHERYHPREQEDW